MLPKLLFSFLFVASCSHHVAPTPSDGGDGAYRLIYTFNIEEGSSLFPRRSAKTIGYDDPAMIVSNTVRDFALHSRDPQYRWPCSWHSGLSTAENFLMTALNLANQAPSERKVQSQEAAKCRWCREWQTTPAQESFARIRPG